MTREVAAPDPEARLRERKKLKTRQAIEAAALRLFTERGFGRVTVEEIARSADVSSRTFFRYFESKEDAVLGPFPELHEVLRRALADARPDEPVLTVLRRAVERLALRLEEQREGLLVRGRIIATTPELLARAHHQRDAWRRTLVEAAASHLGADPSTDLRPHVAAAWAMAGLSAARELWERDASGQDLPSILARAYDLLSAEGQAD
jgi:AcrR family transcriptional regulator